jgi:hypothetical protein
VILEELNVKELEFVGAADEFVVYTIRPNLPALGPRYGKRLPEIRQALAARDALEVVETVERVKIWSCPGWRHGHTAPRRYTHLGRATGKLCRRRRGRVSGCPRHSTHQRINQRRASSGRYPHHQQWAKGSGLQCRGSSRDTIRGQCRTARSHRAAPSIHPAGDARRITGAWPR